MTSGLVFSRSQKYSSTIVSPWMLVVFVFFSAIGGFSGAPPPFPFDCASAVLIELTLKIRSKNVKRDLGCLCMIQSSIPRWSALWAGASAEGRHSLSCGLLAHGQLVVNGSTTRRVAPAGTFVRAVFNYARHRWVAAGIREHFSATGAIVLRVVFGKGDAFGVVEVPRLLAVRTSWFHINY